MLLVTVEASCTISKHRKVAANTLASTHIHVREGAAVAGAAPLVEEVETEWRAFRCRVVR